MTDRRVPLRRVREGAGLRADSGFECLSADQLVVVQRDAPGDDGLFVVCRRGVHRLSRHADHQNDELMYFASGSARSGSVIVTLTGREEDKLAHLELLGVAGLWISRIGKNSYRVSNTPTTTNHGENHAVENLQDRGRARTAGGRARRARGDADRRGVGRDT